MTGGPSSLMVVRLRPTLPHRHQCSTIGAEGLSFRVRNGAGRFPFAMTAETLWRCQSSRPYLGNCTVDANTQIFLSVYQVVGLLVPVSYMHCCTSTSGLSTR